MRQVIYIYGAEKRTSSAGEDYTITHIQVDDGQEAEYFGTDVKLGDMVQVLLHKGKIKAQKKVPKKLNSH